MFFHKYGRVNFILYVNVIYCLLILCFADAIAQEGVKGRRERKRGGKAKRKLDEMTSEPLDHNSYWDTMKDKGAVGPFRGEAQAIRDNAMCCYRVVELEEAAATVNLTRNLLYEKEKHHCVFLLRWMAIFLLELRFWMSAT